MSEAFTNTDPAAAAWAITDPVIRLRRLGSEQVFDLAAQKVWILGAAVDCSIRLEDPTGRVSRRHVKLSRPTDTDPWTAEDLGSTNGLRHNRENRNLFQLVPGDEIEIGGITLIAESRRSGELRELLRRIIGWSAVHAEEVDRAFRAVREMAHLRAALILRGAGSLVGVARRIHHLALHGRPWVPLGADDSGTEGLRRADDGMLYVEARTLPADTKQMLALSRAPSSRARLVLAAETAESAAELTSLLPRTATIWIPPLVDRTPELERLLETFGLDAAAELDAPTVSFRPRDLEWLRASGVATLEEAEDVMRRLVALRSWGVAAGARALGITHGALSRWARRRKLPT